MSDSLAAQHRDRRWSDDRLEQFYQHFQQHIEEERTDRKQQQEMYDALFRKGDSDTNTAPGIVQLMVQTAGRVEKLCIAADRQKTFIGGVGAALVAVWFVVTDLGPAFVAWMKKVLA